MKTLHIVRRKVDRLAEAAIRREAATAQSKEAVTVLLIQSAVLGNYSLPVSVYASEPDLLARGATRPYETIDFDRMSQLILDHDRTIVW